ncbi:MAG: glycosyltransferase family 4 protein [Bacteroidia bacterium]|nr:glycosyltransferase family 4 protein [Bacteroidia bacterium]
MEKILFIGKVWPEPASSAAGTRMMQLIELFQSQNFEIVFASASSQSEFSEDLHALNVATASIELNSSSFDAFISKLNPKAVVFDRFTSEEQFGWRVAQHCPDAMRILDTEDLHSLRAARHQALKENRELRNSDLVNDIAKREMASIYRCDLSLIISEFEMNLLIDFFKIDPSILCYLPFLLAPFSQKNFEELPSFNKRKHFISIGNFLHEPNWDAVRYLKKDIWPLIKEKLPQAEIHVYGAYPTQKVFELDNKKEGFLIKGRVKDVNIVVRESKILIAPLRFGAGLKGKLIDAMLNGTPSVTTTIGLEGMNGSLEWPGETGNDPKTISEAAIRLYSDEDLWSKAQQKIPQLINQRFSREKFLSLFLETFEKTLSTLTDHRERNFTGAMLMHHTISASRYMALWIEEKNKSSHTNKTI